MVVSVFLTLRGAAGEGRGLWSLTGPSLFIHFLASTGRAPTGATLLKQGQLQLLGHTLCALVGVGCVQASRSSI